MQATRTCSVNGCDRKHLSHGYCNLHYLRWKRIGEAAEAAPRRNARQSICKISDCDDQHYGKGYCLKHYKRWKKYGDPHHVEKRGASGPKHPAWKGNGVGYFAAHNRVRNTRGNACDYDCQHCGGPATDWAYDNADPNGLKNERGYAYSPDPAHYIPLCHSCHQRFDRAHRVGATP